MKRKGKEIDNSNVSSLQPSPPKGSKVVGKSDWNYLVSNITFKKPFNTIPTILRLSYKEYAGEKFSFKMLDVQTTGFQVLIQRTDQQKGWEQGLKVEYLAWDNTSRRSKGESSNTDTDAPRPAQAEDSPAVVGTPEHTRDEL